MSGRDRVTSSCNCSPFRRALSDREKTMLQDATRPPSPEINERTMTLLKALYKEWCKEDAKLLRFVDGVEMTQSEWRKKVGVLFPDASDPLSSATPPRSRRARRNERSRSDDGTV